MVGVISNKELKFKFKWIKDHEVAKMQTDFISFQRLCISYTGARINKLQGFDSNFVQHYYLL